MASRAADFVQDWTITNIHPGKPDLDAEARRCADQCLALAGANGLSRADIEAEVGDLTGHLRRALDRAELFKVKRQSGT